MIGKDLSAIRWGLAILHESLRKKSEILRKINQQILMELIEGVLDLEVYRIMSCLFKFSSFPGL